MKIRGKLLFGFGFYILIALALGLFAYGELRIITARLTVVEAADDIANTLLEVRRYEKNYLLYKDEESARSFRRYLGDLRAAIDRIRLVTGAEIPAEHFARMNAVLAEYEGAFNDLTDTLKAQGEKAGENRFQERMREKARDLQSQAEALSAKERGAIDGLLERAGRSLRILLAAMLAAIVFGVIVNRRLSASIAVPLGDLEGLTKKIAAGDFSKRIAVRGDDELSSLGTSFNLMQDRIRDTLTTLEQANAELRENRAQLVEAEKLATLGRFSVGVAHEINNPLAIINEKAGLMKDYLERAEDFRDKERFSALLAAIFASVQRSRGITHRILDFAGQPGDSPEAVDLNAPGPGGGRPARTGDRAQGHPGAAGSVGGASPRDERSDADPAGAREHPAECRRSGRRGGRDRRRHRPEGCRHPAGVDRGQRPRHPRGGSEAHLRALPAHVEGDRQGRGAGARHLLRHHQAARRAPSSSEASPNKGTVFTVELPG